MTECILLISDIRLWIHLGCSEQEKHHPQLVSIDLEFVFDVPPKATDTDNLSDTICYAKVVEDINNAVQKKHFNVIESFSKAVHNETLKHCKGQKASLNVTVTKLMPPVQGIHGGVSFSYRR